MLNKYFNFKFLKPKIQIEYNYNINNKMLTLVFLINLKLNT